MGISHKRCSTPAPKGKPTRSQAHVQPVIRSGVDQRYSVEGCWYCVEPTIMGAGGWGVLGKYYAQEPGTDDRVGDHRLRVVRGIWEADIRVPQPDIATGGSVGRAYILRQTLQKRWKLYFNI